jgi:glycosidase
MREIHVSRGARDRYQFDEALFGASGNAILANFHAARRFAQRMNEQRDLVSYPERAVRASQVNALGLVHEILHALIKAYRETVDPQVTRRALLSLYGRLGRPSVEATLRRFLQEFPPLVVYRREQAVSEYLEGETEGTPNREVALEELLLLWITNENPAAWPFRELFDDSGLRREVPYPQVLAGLAEILGGMPLPGVTAGGGRAMLGPGESLLELLRAPAQASPHSLTGQLEFLLRRWGHLLSTFSYRLLISLDLIKEEEKLASFGAGPAQVLEYAGLEHEPERFTPDREWMPTVVLMAKNAYVWLDQLARKYDRPIQTLDQIPDEELDQLALWGFTGLWLIGLWERSPASQRLKLLMGNPDAVASAYSLFEYRIADDLGGEAACESLRERARARGIRLASDMVPNHVGLDSPWVIEHPEWFIAVDNSPFPVYTFEGPDFSPDPRVGIFIEDHYYTRSDAAVVFKRVDRENDAERYVYHGNDGTVMPWNDTAQLNFLVPEVREAVYQAIRQVARQFPIIRFDAAMTLAKRHYQRLWFPEPGSGGAIASRAEQGLTKAEFDRRMPVEFWREVVDRMAQDAPDTLLLAEAFWLMEGYFVRTLGMHRVYNSAFMNMLRDEENGKYRAVMKNTLEFDPEILKRFVNFMNNPDERTAVDQFGKGDKYFGCCIVMATLPGTPMFGHGQIEGFGERYGMEYRRAQREEEPDPYLIERHEREIFPLLHRRYLFAEVENFRLYDFEDADGNVINDVFAYSNRVGEERALVVYNNRYATSRGWIRTSVAYAMKDGGEDRTLVRKPLGEGLALRGESGYFYIFRDHNTGLEYLRNSQRLRSEGFYVELGGFKAQVLLDFRAVQDDARKRYSHLEAYLDGRGVPSIEEALREVLLQPVHDPFADLVSAGVLRRLDEARGLPTAPEPALVAEVRAKTDELLAAVKELTNGTGEVTEIAAALQAELEVILRLPELDGRSAAAFASAPRRGTPSAGAGQPRSGPAGNGRAARGGGETSPLSAGRASSRARPSPAESGADSTIYKTVREYLEPRLGADGEVSAPLLGWHFSHALGRLVDETDFAERSRSWLDEWFLGRLLGASFRELGLDAGATDRALTVVKILNTHQRWFDGLALPEQTAGPLLEGWLHDEEVRRYLQINRHQGILWFNKESLEELLFWMLLVATVSILSDRRLETTEQVRALGACHQAITRLRRASDRSGYQVEALLEATRALPVRVAR